MSEILTQDYITLTICFLIFWSVIISLYLYPYLQSKKIEKRTKQLKRGE